MQVELMESEIEVKTEYESGALNFGEDTKCGETVCFSFTPLFLTKQEAIDQLLQWVLCRECGIISQPFSVRQKLCDDGMYRQKYVLGCGHTRTSLRKEENIIRAVRGKKKECLFLTFETREPYPRDDVDHKYGRQVEHYTQWAHSFLTQYYQILYAFQQSVYGTLASQININNTSNSATAVPNNYSSSATLTNNVMNSEVMAFISGSGNTYYGMLAGTGSSANTGSTYALGTLIANGTSSGQLQYGGNSITSPSGTSPLSYAFARILTNNSSASITINEVAMVSQTSSASSSSNPGSYFTVIRDYNAGGLCTITNTNNTTGTYTLSYTIS